MNSPDPLPPIYDETPHFRWRLPLAVAAILIAGALVGMQWMQTGETPAVAHPPAPARLPPLDATLRAYFSNIEITGVTPSKWENMLGQEVVYVDGRIMNRGARTVRALELTLVFYDIDNLVVLRETFRPAGSSAPPAGSGWGAPLQPDESRAFRVGFDSVPAAWNQRTPTVRITGLLLEHAPNSPDSPDQ